MHDAAAGVKAMADKIKKFKHHFCQTFATWRKRSDQHIE